jgi:imidazoleglycerol-phosphate dehydratase
MKRKTDEVEVSLDFVKEEVRIETGDDILDHLLETLFFYMETPVSIQASGDLPHHLWEDTGILIGRALRASIDESSITRYGSAVIPMDEALVLCVVDVSRPHLNFDLNPSEEEDGFSPVMAKQFLAGLARTLEGTIHLKQLDGENSHHVIEAGFKALGVSLSEALAGSERLESTKGDLR